MNPFNVTLITIIVLAAIAGILAIGTRPRVVLVCTPLIVMAIFGIMLLHTTLPSRAKSAVLETEDVREAEVLWVEAVQGDSINLLLRWSNSGGPRLYSIPWSKEMADQIKEAQTLARARGHYMKVRNPFKGLLIPKSSKRGRPGDGEEGTGGARGSTGTGGPSTGDNKNADRKFYAPGPTPLPEKYAPQPEGE